MQKQIAKQWTDHASLRGPFPPVFRRAVGHLQLELQATAQYTATPIYNLCASPQPASEAHDLIVVEEASDIKIQHPMISPAPLRASPTASAPTCPADTHKSLDENEAPVSVPDTA